MNLFVRNLSYELTEEKLKNLFEPYSPFSVRIIKDMKTGKSKGFGFVEIKDESKAKKAILELQGKILEGRNISIKVADERRKDGFKNQSSSKKVNSDTNSEVSPYDFCKRVTERQEPVQYHNELNQGYDIAFEIIWKTLTPIAANPCVDYSEQKSCPPYNEKEYSGYNRRWLMIDNCLAISPFTVKSAIANGFANLLGGCYRVMNENKVVGHGEITEGQYPYNGCYKRYRAAQDRSKAGIIKSIDSESGNIVIQPVNEYFYKPKNPPIGIDKFKKGQRYYVKASYKPGKTRGLKNYIYDDNIRNASGKKQSNETEVIYFGLYSYGINSQFGYRKITDSEHPVKYYHRFYKPENAILKTGVIDKINFSTLGKLKEKVYMGKYKNKKNGEPWYEDLTVLKPGDWIYYEEFDCEVTNISKCFGFKALFQHEDAVPDENKQCRDMKNLCPRCRMFGMTDESKSENRESVGCKGRFKSSALLNTIELTEETISSSVPFLQNKKPVDLPVKMKVWKHDSNKICQQFLLPIQLSPKPNKRDVNGYFDKDTGQIKGAKFYRHGLSQPKNLDDLKQNIICQTDDKKDLNPETGKFEYSHELRNYAQVCESGIKFTGTIGAENCTLEEIAAFLILLDSKFTKSEFNIKHGFKIGYGKALGLGSIESSINKIWIRLKDHYEKWCVLESTGALKMYLSGNGKYKELEMLVKKIQNERNYSNNELINSLIDCDNIKLKYDEPKNYWRFFWIS